MEGRWDQKRTPKRWPTRREYHDIVFDLEGVNKVVFLFTRSNDDVIE